MVAQLLDGKLVAAKIKDNLRRIVGRHERKPSLAACLIGEDPASRIYIANKQKACEEVGIRSTLHEFPDNAELVAVLEWVEWCNNSPDVSGVLVQLPLPERFDTKFILSQINPFKDVDCFHPENQGLLMTGQPRFLPCTPAGIIEILKHYNIRPYGKHVVIVNNTIVIGQPLASLLMQDNEWGNATVTVCHRHTRDIERFCLSADIIITAVGKPGYRLTADMVSEGAAVVDVGIFRDERTSKIRGDAVFDEVAKKASWISPVVGGCGPCTVACLLKNTVQAYETANGLT